MDVVTVTNVTKSFKLYKERASTLKERILRKGRNKYEKFLALDDVSITIKKGQTVGLLGRNGSGKSTLLKLLTGILYPDHGQINMQGKVSSLLELGAGFHPDFTGRENIFMNAAILGLTKKEIKAKLNQIIAFSELKDYIDNPVKNYSSGMYMRLAFSIAIMVEPDILLIDEVLAVGDAAFQQKCMDQLIKLKTKGTTIIFVSHDLGATKKLCDRVIWINRGKIIDDGLPGKVIDGYLAYLANEENIRMIEEQQQSVDKTEEDAGVIDHQESVAAYQPETDPGNDSNRRGNRFVEITDVILSNSDKTKKLSFMSGEALEINLIYKVNKTVENPVFGVSFYTIDNTLCYGTSTYIDQYEMNHFTVGDTGTVVFKVPSLDFIAGTYTISVSVQDQNGNQYDLHDKRNSFKVTSLSDETGIAKLNHYWERISN
jgi:ABC-type polysaccharide/polyol phosphate transport system ATPase subunit